MALQSTAPLSILLTAGTNDRSISYEVHGNTTPTKSLSGLISSAGKTGIFNNTLDFLGYSNVVAATVQWTYPNDSTLTSAEYNINGNWNSFSGTRTEVVTGTVGYRLTYSFTSSGGGSVLCGSTNGGDDLGGLSLGGSGTIVWELNNISTSASNMYFTETITGT